MTTRRALTIGLTIAAGLMPALPAQLAASAENRAATVEVIAENLSAPRGLTFAPGRRALYVAESGEGGAGPCAPHPILGDACFGKSGAITRVDRRGSETVVADLGSIAGPTEGLGPHDVAVRGRHLVFTTGLAGSPELRAAFGPEAEATLGYLMSKAGSVADLVAFEGQANPDGGPIDSNPFGVLAWGSSTYVADAGANALLRVSRQGDVEVVAVFPDRLVEFGGQQISMDAVPTTVVNGPGGDLFVGQLTGFPFPVGGANIFRVPKEGGEPTVFASGFTNIIDIAFGRDRSLYVLEIAHNSLLAPQPEGAVTRVDRDGSREIVADGLFFPGGLEVGRRGELFVTNCGICFDDGQVLRIRP